MRTRKLFFAVALALALTGTGHAQDETPGTQTTIQANVDEGFPCGRYTTLTNCYGVPLNVGGTVWFRMYTAGPQAGSGSFNFNNVLDFGFSPFNNGQVTTRDERGRPTTIVVNFQIPSNDGDNDVFNATATLTFNYYYSPYKYAGWYSRLTGASIVVTY